MIVSGVQLYVFFTDYGILNIILCRISDTLPEIWVSVYDIIVPIVLGLR